MYSYALSRCKLHCCLNNNAAYNIPRLTSIYEIVQHASETQQPFCVIIPNSWLTNWAGQTNIVGAFEILPTWASHFFINRYFVMFDVGNEFVVWENKATKLVYKNYIYVDITSNKQWRNYTYATVKRLLTTRAPSQYKDRLSQLWGFPC